MAISILHTFPSNHICKKKWDFIYSHKRQQLRNGTWNLLVTCLMSHHLEEKTKSRDCLIYSVNLISSGKIWPKCLFLHVRAEDYKNRNIVTHTHTHRGKSQFTFMKTEYYWSLRKTALFWASHPLNSNLLINKFWWISYLFLVL
jgi:hypothetical protein